MPTPGTGPQWACHSPAAQLTAGRGTTTATPTPAGFPTWCSFSFRCNATTDLRLHQLSHQKKSLTTFLKVSSVLHSHGWKASLPLQRLRSPTSPSPAGAPPNKGK